MDLCFSLKNIASSSFNSFQDVITGDYQLISSLTILSNLLCLFEQGHQCNARRCMETIESSRKRSLHRRGTLESWRISTFVSRLLEA
jgi:hypothetical protein